MGSAWLLLCVCLVLWRVPRIGVAVATAEALTAATWGAGAGADAWEPLTTSGSLRGRLVQTPHGAVAQFLGVKYAQVGERFEWPLPFVVKEPLRVVDTDAFAPKCPQPPHRPDLMHPALGARAGRPGAAVWAEDCLHLNVWAPVAPPPGPATEPRGRPLLLWLPGDGFDFADPALIDASSLAARADAVVVTAAYRLGAFGFLSAGNASLRGNAAVGDAVAALRWAWQNARAFGADPARVTLGGHFTGAALAALAVASPLAVDVPLAQTATTTTTTAPASTPSDGDSGSGDEDQQPQQQSGCPFLRSAVGCGGGAGSEAGSEADRPLAARLLLLSGVAPVALTADSSPGPGAAAAAAPSLAALARATGCQRATFEQTLSCLRSLPAARLLAASTWPTRGAGAGWRPRAGDPRVPLSPLRAARRGALGGAGGGALLGGAQHEGALCVLKHFALESALASRIATDNLTRKDFAALVSEHLADLYGTQEPALVDTTVHEYRVWTNGSNLRSNFLRFCGAMMVRAPQEQLARALARRGVAVWRYEWAHRPVASPHPAFLGAAHGDDLPFLFGLLPTPPADAGASNTSEAAIERNLSLQLMDAVGNFLRRGNPNTEDTSSWPLFTDSRRAMRVFSARGPEIKSTDFLSQDVDFWGQVAGSILRSSAAAAVSQRRGAVGRCGAARGGRQRPAPQPCDCGALPALIALSGTLAATVAALSFYLAQSSFRSSANRCSAKGLVAQEHLPQ